MEIVKYGDYEGRELIPVRHMRLVRVRRSLQWWCYTYGGVDEDYACFSDLADALRAATAGLFDVVIIDDCDVLGCRCLNCESERARRFKWVCKSLKDGRLIPTSVEVVGNE